MSEQIKSNILKALGVELDEEWNAAGDDVAQYRIHEDDTGALIFQFRIPKYNGFAYGSWHDMSGQKYQDASKKLLWFIAHPEDMVRLGASTAAQKNTPLTLDELQKMDGEPVWVVNSKVKEKEGFHNEWGLVSVKRETAESVGTIYHFENYGEYWLAYRREPEEGTE